MKLYNILYKLLNVVISMYKESKMSVEYEIPFTLKEVQDSNLKTEYNFNNNQLCSDNKGLIIFDLVIAGKGSLFIYQIYLDGIHIGSTWSKSYELERIDPLYGFKYSNKITPAFFYSIEPVFRSSEDAMKLSNTTQKQPYCFDEYWWNEDECGDAFFPTFDTLQQLLDFHLKNVHNS